MSWISWDTICKKKVDGGLGFRNMKLFNAALLAKIRVYRDPWLPQQVLFPPLATRCFMHDNLLISNLLENGSWKLDLVNVPFEDCDRDPVWHYVPYGSLIGITFLSHFVL